ncbi:hypothetical protein [Streptacidiphilus fuscans]|uniref:ScyD/ScyE family protein n=1 Tax=Streptacidiphilus fuscans TaxID=2789292 RepID=A0A931B8L4_9ACTN|nr:hypothetical protein [Streptacidiphilus fuscans]MBF9070662.1 hypothetical protein [Streptacidiphilus fuscans]
MTSRLALAGAVAAAATLAATVVGTAGAATTTSAAPSVTKPVPLSVPAGYHAKVFAAAPKGLTGADDIAQLGDDIFVGYQNGVGTMGEPSPSGNKNSTVVEFDQRGKVVAEWSLVGKVDGLGADPTHRRVVATVNEDGNSSLYTITPQARRGHQVVHYSYGVKTLPHGGGTDAVLEHDGRLYTSASNPSPTTPNGTVFQGPALFQLHLAGGTAKPSSALADDAHAVNLLTGKAETLNLSDPDSLENVPCYVPGVGGSMMLDSQGDSELIFMDTVKANWHSRPTQRVRVLHLSAQVDDTAFAIGDKGAIFAVDGNTNAIVEITGNFGRGQDFTSASSLSRLNLNTGKVTAFAPGIASKGLLFEPFVGR